MSFKKTLAWFRHIKNVFFSKYELAFKQETLFRVSVNGGPEFYLVGTMKPGSFDRILEPLTFPKTMTVEYITISHMTLASKILYGPIFYCVEDQIRITYSLPLKYPCTC